MHYGYDRSIDSLNVDLWPQCLFNNLTLSHMGAADTTRPRIVSFISSLTPGFH